MAINSLGIPVNYSNRPALSDIRPERDNAPSWAHPEVLFWYDEWKLIRDAASGEKDVKAAAEVYLPSLDGMDEDDSDGAEYQAYLDRATYYNFTGRTISALVGTLFKKDPKIEGVPSKLDGLFDVISQTGIDFVSFATGVASELFTLGRYGVLVDMAAVSTTSPEPYVTGYTAENIVDWRWSVERKTGRMVLKRVVLREFELGYTEEDKVQRYFARYRELALTDDGEYVQNYYKREGADANYDDTDSIERIVPLRQGKPLKFIPFMFFGVTKNEPTVEKSPMLDIARINISHYRSYAQLEHGRFYTGLPVYYAENDGSDENAEFTVGPSVVWNLPPNSKAGIIEFNGQGLKFLENALAQKEAHAASLGGRMAGITAQSTAETDNQTELKNRNEQALLLNMSRVLDAGFGIILRWWAWLANTPDAELKKIDVKFSKDFLLSGAGSREFRAIHAMYKDGILPVEVLHDYLVKNEVVPDWLELDEFKKLLESEDSFPNQPDFQARKEGYPNAQAKVTAEGQEAERENEAEMQETQIDADKKAADDAAKRQKDAAKEAAKNQPKPVPGQQPQPGNQQPAPGKPQAVKKPAAK